MGLTDAPWKIKYLYAIYWALVTMLTVGYGDITPQNKQEIIVCVVSVVLGCVVYAYNISSIGMILQEFNKDNVEFTHKINVMNQFMKRKNINGDLQMRIREYLRFIWKEEKLQNLEKEHQIIDSLSQTLKEELLMQAYGGILKRHPMFYSNFSEKSLRKIVNIIKDVRLFPDETLFLENDEDTKLYFVMKGKMELFLNGSKNTGLVLKNLEVGENFGEIEFFSGRLRLFSAKSRGFTTLFSIDREEFIKILQKNPEDWEKFCMIRDQIILYNNYYPLKIRCYCCNQLGHLAGTCSFIHFEADREKILKSYDFYFDQERNSSHLRKNNRKNALKQKNSLIKAHRKLVDLSLKEKESQHINCDLTSNTSFDESNHEILFEDDDKSEKLNLNESLKKIVTFAEEEKNYANNDFNKSCEEIREFDNNIESTKPNSELMIPRLNLIENVIQQKLNMKKPSFEETKTQKNMQRNKTRLLSNESPSRRNQNPESNEFTFEEFENRRKQHLPEITNKLTTVNSIMQIGLKTLPNITNSEIISKNQDNKTMDFFEKVNIFKNYFPEGNVNVAIGNINKLLNLKVFRKNKEVRRSMEMKKKLGRYTFFTDEMKERMPEIIKKKIKTQRRKRRMGLEVETPSRRIKNKKNLSFGMHSERKFVDLVKNIIINSRNKKKYVKIKKKY